MRYRVKIIRGHEIEIEIDAYKKSNALIKVLRAALKWDAKDQKVTEIVSITEAPKDVHHPLN